MANMVEHWIKTTCILTMLQAVFACNPDRSELSEFKFPESVPHPELNPASPDRIELGKMLFFDPRLSGNNDMSCATCHRPDLGWTDGLVLGNGQEDIKLPRNTPTILNTGFGALQFWDGRASSLEDQALGPINSAIEMNQNIDDLLIELNNIEDYEKRFARAYPGEGVSKATIAKALAAFQRNVVSRNSNFDKWMNGDSQAMSDSAVRGFELFKGKARCAECHQGFNFTDNGFHNIGLVDKNGIPDPDPGRFAHLPLPSMKGAFKTPTLRDITLTAPYMHNGQYNTLEEVVEHYVRGGDTRQNLSPNMQALTLTQNEKQDLVEFMKNLESPQLQMSIPDLPVAQNSKSENMVVQYEKN